MWIRTTVRPAQSALPAPASSPTAFPFLPGAMFLLGYFEDGTPVMGLPGGILYVNASVFDLILPRVAAGVEVTAADLAKMGHGGLCLGCPSCTYPCCPFGKGT